MTFDDVLPFIRTMPYTSATQNRALYDFVVAHGCERVLELGTAFGKATISMAAALHRLGRGRVDTVDLRAAQERIYDYSVAKAARAAGLEEFVAVHAENHTYNWFLMKVLRASLVDGRVVPPYDFIFLDGAHNWTVDVAAFHLCSRLLKPGGVLLLDDLRYNYFDMNARDGKANDWSVDDADPRARVIRAPMGEDEMKACHVGLLYDLCVRTDPRFEDFRVTSDGNWGWATKRRDLPADVAP